MAPVRVLCMGCLPWSKMPLQGLIVPITRGTRSSRPFDLVSWRIVMSFSNMGKTEGVVKRLMDINFPSMWMLKVYRIVVVLSVCLFSLWHPFSGVPQPIINSWTSTKWWAIVLLAVALALWSVRAPHLTFYSCFFFLVIRHCHPTFLYLAHSSVHGFTKDIICSKLGSVAAASGLCQASSDPFSKSGPRDTLCNSLLHHAPCGDNYMHTFCLLHQTSHFSKSKAMFYSSLCPYCLQESPWLGDFGLAVSKLNRSLISSGSVIQYYPRLSIFVVPIWLDSY